MADEPIVVPTQNLETPPSQEGGETGATVNTPSFDPSVLQQTIADSIRSGFEGFAQQMTPQAPVTPPTAPQADPLASTLNPYIQPAQMTASAALDASVFYATNDAAKGYANKIEELARQHPTTPRSTIWQFIKGSDEYINAQVQARLDETRRAAEQAAQASTVGVGSPDRNYGGAVRQAREMAADDLTRALEGISF